MKIKKEYIKKALDAVRAIKKTNESKIIMRKTYQKNIWKKKAIMVLAFLLVVIIILSIIFAVIFLIKREKSQNKFSSESKKPLEMQSPGKVVEIEKIEEALPDNSEVIAQGRFSNVEQTVKGKALFVKSGEDIFLRFEDFETLNGQDMHVYLSPILNLDTNDVIDAGLLKAISGNINYKLDKGVNLDKYNNVLIWSNRFNAFFGYAVLQKGELPPEVVLETVPTEEENNLENQSEQLQTDELTQGQTQPEQPQVDEIIQEQALENTVQ